MFHVVDSNNGEEDPTALALSPDGNVYFSGSFTSVNRDPHPKLVRLFGSPVPIALKASSLAGEFTFNWSNPALHLQSAPFVQGPYEDVQEAKSPWKPSPSEGQQFFRLRSN